MSYHIGNKFAEKWTPETVLPILTRMEEDMAGCLFLGELLVKHKLYRDIWTYWTEKFKDTEDVFLSIKRIDQFFESQLFGMALRGKTNATMAIFGLKNNHGWEDRTKQEHTGDNGAPLALNITVIDSGKDIPNQEKDVDL